MDKTNDIIFEMLLKERGLTIKDLEPKVKVSKNEKFKRTDLMYNYKTM